MRMFKVVDMGSIEERKCFALSGDQELAGYLAGEMDAVQRAGAAGLPTCGTGRSLAEAAAPIYLDAPGGRYAVIGACSTFYPDAMAGEQTRTMPGRAAARDRGRAGPQRRPRAGTLAGLSPRAA